MSDSYIQSLERQVDEARQTIVNLRRRVAELEKRVSDYGWEREALLQDKQAREYGEWK